MDLFEYKSEKEMSSTNPLPDQLRPETLDTFVGQSALFKSNSILSQFLKGRSSLPNLIFWGPPGTGKTTLALLLAKEGRYHWIAANAIDTGAKQLRELGHQARHRKLNLGERTLLFIDEIHRLNRAQQDVLLPFCERGDFTLLGATTENPGYELNRALLSRSHVLRFEPLAEQDLHALALRVLAHAQLSPEKVFLPGVLESLLTSAAGDGRRAILLIESVLRLYHAQSEEQPLSFADVEEELKKGFVAHDKKGDSHYDIISAFIKSMRGSDADAALYYLARMLAAGEDPVFIARRMVIFASEDVGNADPQALSMAVAVFDAVERIGLPEAAINLAQGVSYLSSTSKSNRSYIALRKAQAVVEETGELEVPLSLRSAQTSFAKSQGYGKGYRYSHNDSPDAEKQEFLPSKIRGQIFYEPKMVGREEEFMRPKAKSRDQKS